MAAQKPPFHLFIILIIGVLALLGLMLPGSAQVSAAPPSDPALPLPHTLPLDQFEKLLYTFLDTKAYSGWVHDKGVRDTGPLVDGSYKGTHGAVFIYYSPEVMDWLKNGRQGAIANGAIIVKEMFTPPAARYAGMSVADIQKKINGWTVMVRDSSLSKDGWYSSYYGLGQSVDSNAYPFDYPNSGSGQYCARCHASAASELTFVSENNIEGFPGDPLQFFVDNSWLTPVPTAAPKPTPLIAHGMLADGPDVAALGASKPVRGLNPGFVETFNTIPPQPVNQIVPMPPLTYDHVVSGPNGPRQFITSDQCLGCHDGNGAPFGPNMYIPGPDGKNANLSPYGEWNWSMMGLAGRDPIFYAQLDSERKLQPTHAEFVTDLCLSCHGVMGQRQFHIDHPNEEYYHLDNVYKTDSNDPGSVYGALSRDGISCMVCHQIVDDKLPFQDIDTGRFKVSTPGEFEPGISSVYGPFDKPVTRAMSVTLGIKPVQNDYTKSSRLCGSCHTINLPVYDTNGAQTGTFFEQSTYLEWENSAYQDEFPVKGSDPQSCQDCHMPKRFPDNPGGAALSYRIANVEDQTYPEVDNHAPTNEITVPIRNDFARHVLQGLNQFGLEMFNQFDDILGVRKTDYMTGSANGLPFAIETNNQFATEKTASVNISDLKIEDGKLNATVKVTNLAGHRFPSGVGFRRAFLQFQVIDEQNNVVWSSGQTNAEGIIVGANGQPLPTEFYKVDPATGKQMFQPHYQTITSPDQVQIYQELVEDSEGKITTSFIELAHELKDNRLLPKGWTPNGPEGFQYANVTMPFANAATDPDFTDGTGSDTLTYSVPVPAGFGEGGKVIATLYYQAIPPAYLNDRFTIAPDGVGTQRLYYLASHLNLDNTNIKNWKLPIAAAVAPTDPSN